MRLRWLGVVLLGLLSATAVARDNPSAAFAGDYQAADKKRLASNFVNVVNHWLHRYERTLITQSPEYVRMQVRYDYVYDLEFTVKDDRFVIKVTGSERARSTLGQRNATNLGAGLLRRMENKKRERSDVNDRWTRSN